MKFEDLSVGSLFQYNGVNYLKSNSIQGITEDSLFETIVGEVRMVRLAAKVGESFNVKPSRFVKQFIPSLLGSKVTVESISGRHFDVGGDYLLDLFDVYVNTRWV